MVDKSPYSNFGQRDQSGHREASRTQHATRKVTKQPEARTSNKVTSATSNNGDTFSGSGENDRTIYPYPNPVVRVNLPASSIPRVVDTRKPVANPRHYRHLHVPRFGDSPSAIDAFKHHATQKDALDDVARQLSAAEAGTGVTSTPFSPHAEMIGLQELEARTDNVRGYLACKRDQGVATYRLVDRGREHLRKNIEMGDSVAQRRAQSNRSAGQDQTVKEECDSLERGALGWPKGIENPARSEQEVLRAMDSGYLISGTNRSMLLTDGELGIILSDSTDLSEQLTPQLEVEWPDFGRHSPPVPLMRADRQTLEAESDLDLDTLMKYLGSPEPSSPKKDEHKDRPHSPALRGGGKAQNKDSEQGCNPASTAKPTPRPASSHTGINSPEQELKAPSPEPRASISHANIPHRIESPTSVANHGKQELEAEEEASAQSKAKKMVSSKAMASEDTERRPHSLATFRSPSPQYGNKKRIRGEYSGPGSENEENDLTVRNRKRKNDSLFDEPGRPTLSTPKAPEQRLNNHRLSRDDHKAEIQRPGSMTNGQRSHLPQTNSPQAVDPQNLSVNEKYHQPRKVMSSQEGHKHQKLDLSSNNLLGHSPAQQNRISMPGSEQAYGKAQQNSQMRMRISQSNGDGSPHQLRSLNVRTDSSIFNDLYDPSLFDFSDFPNPETSLLDFPIQQQNPFLRPENSFSMPMNHRQQQHQQQQQRNTLSQRTQAQQTNIYCLFPPQQNVQPTQQNMNPRFAAAPFPNGHYFGSKTQQYPNAYFSPYQPVQGHMQHPNNNTIFQQTASVTNHPARQLYTMQQPHNMQQMRPPQQQHQHRQNHPLNTPSPQPSRNHQAAFRPAEQINGNGRSLYVTAPAQAAPVGVNGGDWAAMMMMPPHGQSPAPAAENGQADPAQNGSAQTPRTPGGSVAQILQNEQDLARLYGRWG